MQLNMSRLFPIFDQVLFAATNFSLAIILARYHSPEVVAAYGLGLSVALVLQAIQRHVIIIPLNLRKKVKNEKLSRTWLGTHFIATGCMLSFVGVFCSLATQLLMKEYVNLVAFSVLALIIIYMQAEFGRAFLIAINQTKFVIVPAIFQISAVSYIAYFGVQDPYAYIKILAILVAASTASAFLLVTLVGSPEWVFGDRHLRRLIRKYARWGSLGVLASAGYNHVPLLILGVFASPLQAAAFITMRNLLQPSQVLMRGLDIVDKRKVGGFRYTDTTAMYRKADQLVLAYGLLAAAYALVINLGGEWLSGVVYGEGYRVFADLLVPWAVIYVLMAMLFPLESLAYASDKIKSYYTIRIFAGVAATMMAFPLIWNLHAMGAVIACLIGWVITVGGTYWMLKRSEWKNVAVTNIKNAGEV
ncbi:MAG: lipopolysaccharide biosynthesis protein [Rhizobiaceae bacterium]